MRRLSLTRLVFEERGRRMETRLPEPLAHENCSADSRRLLRSLPGDPCEKSVETQCHGELIVYSTKVESEMRVRYLMCSCCKHKPADNKWVVPIVG